MNSQLYMVELELDMAALFRFLQPHGLKMNKDQDLGYATHAWLAATFGKRAPKPFRLFHAKRGCPARVLGYTDGGREELAQQAHEFALPTALAVCDLEKRFNSKLMPGRWDRGRRLGFRVLACPISRKDDGEKDVFLRAVERVSKEDVLDREAIYCDWLRRQLEAGAKVDHVKLEGFQMLQHYRRGTPGRAGKLIRPHAELSGVLEVTDEEKFAHALARGVGRHRSFGYGMLLLRPAP